MHIKKDKGGINITLEGIIGMVLGIICIFILVFYAAPIITSIFFSQEKPVLQAQGTLKKIVKAISDESELVILAPEGWFLISTSEDVINSKVIISLKCEDKNCVCVCPKKLLRKVDCTNNGQCGIIEKPLLSEGGLVYKPIKPSKLKIAEEKDYYSLTEIT